MIVYLLLLSFKQRIREEEREDVVLAPPRDADRNTSASKAKNEKMLENKNTRTPACGIVTLLGEKLKGLWKIGIHWLKAVRNSFTSPLNSETIRMLNSV